MKAISLWQPWPWLIFRPDIAPECRTCDRKDVENRPVHFRHTGELVICATQKLDPGIDALRIRLAGNHGIILPETFDMGGIVGVITVGPMNNRNESHWFTGPWAWPILRQRIIPFQAMAGRQGLFNLKPEYENYVKAQLAKF